MTNMIKYDKCALFTYQYVTKAVHQKQCMNINAGIVMGNLFVNHFVKITFCFFH